MHVCLGGADYVLEDICPLNGLCDKLTPTSMAPVRLARGMATSLTFDAHPATQCVLDTDSSCFIKACSYRESDSNACRG